jgi:hypothetical protein
MEAENLKTLLVSLALVTVTLLALAQEIKPGVLGADDLKRVVPSVYFFRGQSATVQIRNAGGFAAADGKLVLAALVDTSGYATDVQAKYQGLLITEIKLNVHGTSLPPGQYGFGFTKDGKFLVSDVGANDLLKADTQSDDKLTHPVPLKMAADGTGYRLYAGRKWVTLKPE